MSFLAVAPPSGANKKEMAGRYWKLIASVVAWYAANAANNVLMKETFSEKGVLVHRQQSHFIDVLMLQCVLSAAFGTIHRAFKRTDANEVGFEIFRKHLMLSFGVCAFHCIGTAATNALYILTTATVTQILKSTEPVVTIFLAAPLLMRLPTINDLVGVSLVAGGVVLCCWKNSGPTTHQAFFAAAISAINNPLRNILTKKLAKQSNTDTGSIFISTNLMLVVIIAPLWAAKCYFNEVNLPTEGYLASICFALYQIASFQVLGEMTPESHSVANVFKRLNTITISIFWEQTKISRNFLFGIFLAFSGLTLRSVKVTSLKKNFQWHYLLVPIFTLVFVALCMNLGASGRVSTVEEKIQVTPVLNKSLSGVLLNMEASIDDYIRNAERQLAEIKPSLKVAFLHRYDSSNLGDFVASPLDYFPFLQSLDHRHFDLGWPGCLEQNKILNELCEFDMVIVGGGGLITCSQVWDGTLATIAAHHRLSVLWGAGLNNNVPVPHRPMEGYIVPDYLKNFTLCGLRDVGLHRVPELYAVPHVDDVTCMHPAFDKYMRQPPTRGNRLHLTVGVYDHFHKKEIVPKDLPCVKGNSTRDSCERLGCAWRPGGSKSNCYFHVKRMCNNETDLGKVLDFFATSDIVISSSFHGMLWATQLGKPVISTNMVTIKDQTMPYPPVQWSGNILDDIQNIMSYTGALETCRLENKIFYSKVLDLLLSSKQLAERGENCNMPANLKARMNNVAHVKTAPWNEACISLKTYESS